MFPLGVNRPASLPGVKARHIVAIEEYELQLKQSATRAKKSDGLRRSVSVGESQLEQNNNPTLVATLRIGKDQLMRTMEDLIVKEAETKNLWESFDQARDKSERQHAEMKAQLEAYQQLFAHLAHQQHPAATSSTDVPESWPQKWKEVDQLVKYTLPDALQKLQHKMDSQSARVDQLHRRMLDIRFERLKLRDEIIRTDQELLQAQEQEQSS